MRLRIRQDGTRAKVPPAEDLGCPRPNLGANASQKVGNILPMARVGLLCAVLVVGLVLPAAAQKGAPAPRTAPAPSPKDPLNRETPRGTIAGINAAVHRGDFVSAARYMQLASGQRAASESLARGLVGLIDRYYVGPIVTLSDAPEGSTNDGLPRDREHIVLTIGGKPVDLTLVRVNDPQNGLIWLISSQTLAQVPALSRSTEGDAWYARALPQALSEKTLFGMYRRGIRPPSTTTPPSP